MPSTVPATPATSGGSRAIARSPATTRHATSQVDKLLTLIQFAFVKHPRINDPHQSLSNVCADAADAEEGIDTLFASAERTDVKNDVDLTKAVRRLLNDHAMLTFGILQSRIEGNSSRSR